MVLAFGMIVDEGARCRKVSSFQGPGTANKVPKLDLKSFCKTSDDWHAALAVSASY